MGIGARGIALSPDNQHLAFRASAESKVPATHRQTDLWVVDMAWSGDMPSITATPHNLTSGLAYEMGGSIGGDNTAPRGGGRGGLMWSADSTHITDIVGYRGSAMLASVDISTPNKVTELTAQKQAILGVTATRDGSRTIALISNPIMIGDLFTIGSGKSQTQITDVNQKLFSQLDIAMPLDIQVKPTHHADDIKGETIDTFLMLPPGVSPTAKPAAPLPFILNIHGGPHSAYGWVFDHEMLYMAGKGYVVDYPNPRGSTTYGANFANIIMNNYPGDDFHDLMDTVDVAIKMGYADPARLGVTGGSGGGLLTDWVVTQTDRFKAAVAQRDITDWAGWWYTSDAVGFHQSFLSQAGSVGESQRLRRTLARHLRRQPENADDVHPRRRRLPHSALLRRRGLLPRTEVQEDPHRHGSLPARKPRALPLRRALAPHRAPRKHRQLVRSLPHGQVRTPVRHRPHLHRRIHQLSRL